MKVAFFGLAGSFDFNQIGGMDSLVRRLAFQLADRGDCADFLHYGIEKDLGRRVHENIQIRHFPSMPDVFETIGGTYDHVVTIYLRPKDRFAYARFRKAQRKSTAFHHIYATWPESHWKRCLLFAEARLWPYNGCLFGISPRIQRYVSRWARRTALLLPPAPRDYFLSPTDKPGGDRLRVAYVGRLDPGKGTPEAIEVLRCLGRRSDVHARLLGFAWRHRPETVRLHQALLAQTEVTYEPAEYEKWTPQVEDHLRLVLRETDVLLLPYRRLSSTVDTPLLLLEGMASLCAVMTPPLGDMPSIYGCDDFLLRTDWSPEQIAERILRLRPRLPDERRRLHGWNEESAFDADRVAERFRSALESHRNNSE